MALAKRHLGVQAEPGGAVAFAALLNGDLPETYKTVCIILSGGNVDPDIAARADSILDPPV